MRNTRQYLSLTAAVGLLAAGFGAPDALAQGVVAGTVVRSGTLTPIEGAQIQVEGTRIGTTTDASGRFRLANVPGDRVRLQVRRISLTPITQEVRVGASDVRIVMGESTVRLDEVVITGTAVGVQQRSVGNVVSKISAVEEVEKSGVGDLGSLVNARAPGVIVTSGSGRTGAGPSINIRGRSTISLSQQPLLYIDGVRVTNDIGTGTRLQGGSPASRLNDVSPEDIESIEIIKGPAAATIYGTEAANGVIQIITKKGRIGSAPQWTATVRQGTQWFSDPEGRIATNYAICTAAHVVTTSPAAPCHGQPVGTIVSWNAAQQEAARGTPIWKSGRLQTYAGSISGGVQAVRYHVSGTYDDDKGIEPNNSARRFTGHANITVAPSEKIDVTSSINLIRGLTHLGTDYGASTLWSAQYSSPLTVNSGLRGFNLMPPEAVWALYDNTQDVSRFTGSLQFNHRPISWLSQRLTVGIDQTTEDNQGLSRFAPPEYRQFLSATNARGSLLQDIRNITYYTADYGGTANFDLTSALSSATSIGGQFYQKRLATSQATGREFPAPGLRTVRAAAIREGSQDYQANTTIGVYLQQQLGWQDRLFLTGAVRVDNNSAFGEDFDFVTYPKLSGSWVISEESFWEAARPIVGTLKLRAAYGQSGLQPEVFTALQTYQPITGTGDAAAVSPQEIGNPDLKPERGTEIEAGFEAGLWDRVSLDFTYFSRRTKDAILLRPVAPSLGFPGNQYVNIGATSNRGVEFQGRVQAIAREGLGWEVGLNLGTTRDRIEDMGGIPFIAVPGLPQRHVEGYPIGAMWAKRVTSATITAAGAATNVMCDNGRGGEILCSDPASQPVFLGTITPRVTGAFTNTVTLGKNLRLYAMVDFKRGHKMLNTDDVIRCAIFRLCEVNVSPEKFSPQYVANAQNGSALVIVDQFVNDASFTKLREVSASYTLPDRFARYARASRATIVVAGRNLHTWTKYPGLDPESRSQIQNVTAFDQAITPSLAQFITTFNFTF
ncbi:MAG: SusC/RagA family TonB-linked outer membrane protein [Gemmatimonadota bacterium]|nr:SusC/RagA family TonB-linked outer membrane protein [Gemmatimonadota bacterium]